MGKPIDVTPPTEDEAHHDVTCHDDTHHDEARQAETRVSAVRVPLESLGPMYQHIPEHIQALLDDPVSLLEDARHGNVHALFLVGLMKLGYIEQTHPEVEALAMSGLACVEQAARGGLMVASVHLSMLYAKGIHVEQNLDQAIYWAQQAVEIAVRDDHVLLSMLLGLLGTLCRQADESSLEAKKALTYLTEVADSGNPWAQHQCGLIALEKGERDALPQAYEWFLKAARQSLANAQYMLGMMYAQALTPQHDVDQAWVWMKKAADQGDGDAWVTMAQWYHDGLGQQSPDPEQVKHCMRKAAHCGQATAQVWLAVDLLEQDDEKAQKQARDWLLKAAQQDHVDALWILGDLAMNEEPANRKEAVKRWSQAAELGSTRAMVKLAQLFLNAPESEAEGLQAVTWLMQAAGEGDPTGQFLLAKCYYEGQVVPKNREKATALMQQAADGGDVFAKAMIGQYLAVEGQLDEAIAILSQSAEEGNVHAQFSLGFLYSQDNRVPRDFNQALYWYDRASEQNHPQALYHAGMIFLKGLGRPADAVKALGYFERSAAGGDLEAMQALGHCYEEGLGVEADVQTAFNWFMKAALEGDAVSQFRVGEFYDRGLVGEPNYAEAMGWLNKAASQDFGPACYVLAKHYEQAMGVEQDVEVSYAWLRRAAQLGVKLAQDELALREPTGPKVN